MIKNKLSVWRAFRSQVEVQDCLFLSLVILLSVVLYVWDLGFYSDDWHFLKILNFSEDRSLSGLIRTFFLESPDHWTRPVKAIYQAVQYWLFGLHPLGFHLVNAAVLMAGIVLFYWVLRELSQNRWLALAVPMVYGLLPHYSTDRFWYAACQANLSMALYFLSLYSDLRMVKAKHKWMWGWKILSLTSLLGSSLAYEVFIPLFVLNPLLVLYYKRKTNRSASGTQLSQRKLAVLLASNLLVLMLVIVFKKMTTDRIGGVHLLSHIKFLTKESIAVNYGVYGFGLPRIVWRILWDYPNATILILTGVLGLSIFGYLYRVASQSKVELPKGINMLKLVVLGLVIFGLGYATFLSTNDIFFTPTGINNRTAIAAATGVAFSLVGGLGWLSNLLNSSYSRKCFFCLTIALLCSCGFLINNTIASFWIAAYRQQQEILTDIHQQFPTLATGSTLILDGFCPYIGPGIVFETDWDVQGALGIMYGDLTLKGDVVKPNLKIENDGIFLSIYGAESRHPYKQLFVYNFGRKIKHQLTDADAARRYFAEFNPDYSNGCPKGSEGFGTPIF